MIDPYNNTDDAAAPITSAVAINLANDTVLDRPCRAIYVGGDGNIVASFVAAPATFVTITGVKGGSILPYRLHTIRSTANGTTATALLALF